MVHSFREWAIDIPLQCFLLLTLSDITCAIRRAAGSPPTDHVIYPRCSSSTGKHFPFISLFVTVTISPSLLLFLVPIFCQLPFNQYSLLILYPKSSAAPKHLSYTRSRLISKLCSLVFFIDIHKFDMLSLLCQINKVWTDLHNFQNKEQIVRACLFPHVLCNELFEH